MHAQLGFDSMPQRLIKVSPARLSTFADCPRRYRMAYLDRPTPRRTGGWAHSTLGAVVHNALRALFELPARRRTAARAAELVTENWSDEGFADTEQAGEYRRRARNWVADYVDEHDTGFEPVGLERWVSAPTGTIVAEGRVDRIDERSGELVIVDYKTGRRAPNEDDARGSQALALYAIAARRTLRKPANRVELHHVPTGEIASWEHTDESLRRQRGRAEETAADVQLAVDTLAAGGDPDEVFPATAGRHCGWCDFRPSCPVGQDAAPAAKPWELLAE